MNTLVESATVFEFWEQPLAVLADSGAKGAILLGLAGLIVLSLRRSSAAARHLVWALALIGLLLLPVLSLVLPKWQLPISPRMAMPAQITVAPLPSIVPQATQPEISMITAPESPQTVAGSEQRLAPSSARPLPVGFWLIAAWFVVAFVALVPLLAGFVLVGRLIRRANTLDHAPWPSLLRSISERLGLCRHVMVLQTNRSTMPMTVGVWRTIILLPKEVDEWTEDKRQAVLLHELAHVKRWDYLVHVLTRLACILHWFNPLVWFALKKLQSECERACDDQVLSAGAHPTTYADHLLDIARTMHAGAFTSTAAVTMARRSQLEGRMLAILDATSNRKGITKRALVFTSLLVVGVLLTLGSVSLVGLGNSMPVYAGETEGIDVTSAGLERNEVIGSPLTPEERKIVDLLAGVAEDVSEKFPDKIKSFRGAALYHVHSESEGTAWVYLRLRRKSRCGEDEVSWGSSRVAHAKAEYYLPNGTPLRSRWEPRGNGMYDAWIDIERVVPDGERVPVICRYPIAPEDFHTTVDGKERYIKPPIYSDDRPEAIIVRLDKPLRLTESAFPSGAEIDRHEDFTQVAPGFTDSGALLVRFVGPFTDSWLGLRITENPGLYILTETGQTEKLNPLTKFPANQDKLAAMISENTIASVSPSIRFLLFAPNSTIDDVRSGLWLKIHFRYFDPGPTGLRMGPEIRSSDRKKGLWELSFPQLSSMRSGILRISWEPKGDSDRKYGGMVWVDALSPELVSSPPTLFDFDNYDALIMSNIAAEHSYSFGEEIVFKIPRGKSVRLKCSESHPSNVKEIVVYSFDERLCISCASGEPGMPIATSQPQLKSRAHWTTVGRNYKLGVGTTWNYDEDFVELRLRTRTMKGFPR